MRYKLIIGLIAFTVFGCKNDFDDKSKRNDNWVWWTDAKTRKSSWIPVNSGPSPVTDGKYTRFYFNGNVFERGKLVGGENVDTIFNYGIDGRLLEYRIPEKNQVKDTDERNQIEYFIRNGPTKIYHANGRLSAEGIVINHTYGNKWVSYFDNGKILYLRNSKSDTGWATRYYYNGKVKDSDYYEGSKVLNAKHWYENGQLALSVDIANGNFNGMQKEYFENGQIKAIRHNVDGKNNGEEKFWFEDGKLQGISYKKHGLYDGRHIIYYENGKVQFEINTKNGKADGESKKYDEAGKLVMDYIYKDGVIIDDKLIKPYLH